jgi:nucleolar protein 15
MVLYFGRVPKSMPEEPLRAYLSQFGDISRLRLSRNRKTGASKHYAFVEFEDEEVGQIVQETMNNYLLEGRLLQVRILPKEKVHPSLWIGANKKWRKVPEVRRFRIGHDEPKTPEEKDRVQKKLLKRQQIRRKKIQDQGIEYDFEGYVSAWSVDSIQTGTEALRLLYLFLMAIRHDYC